MTKRMDAQTKALLEDLQSRYPERQRIVRIALAEMPVDKAVETILTWLEHDRRERRNVPYLALGYIGAICLFGWLLRNAFPVASVYPFMIWSAVGSLLSVVATSGKLRRQCYKLLATYDDVRVIEPFVQAMAHGLEDVKLPAIIALTQLLPKLKPADARLLSHDSRRILNEMLVNNVKVDFVLAILSAWEQIGDAEAIPFVEQLTLGKGATGGNQIVRDAAQVALPTLQASAVRNAASDTLLRSSQSSDSSSLLLHPITQNTVEQHTLLQPAPENHTLTSK